MNKSYRTSSICFLRFVFSLGAGLLLAAGFLTKASAADFANLPVVKPVVSCDQFTQADIKTADGAKVTIKTGTVKDTPRGPYCTVSGSIEPGYNFQVSLPIEHWTQRLVMGGFGQASGCEPAMNGEFASGGGGFGGGNANTPPDPLATTWGETPQQRINGAYMNNHMAAVAAKAAIKAFYGQGPKYSYMTGCSAPGLQVLKEAQRFPEDYDGYSIGAPPLYQTTHDLGFWHGWEYHANQRPDGSIILTKEKLPILHAAALEHCAAISGVIDGDLQQPTACKFEKSWVQCAAGATDTSKCLTAEEANVAEQLYLGPNDGKSFFETGGWVPGSELQWHLSSPGKPASAEGQAPHGIHQFLMPPLSGQDTKTIMANFTFSQEWFDKTQPMWGLFNAGNTDLSKLEKLGDKIILWNGAEDTTVEPSTSLSYYEAVQKQMGVKETDNFLRFFLLPGVGHCGGGDSANQVDILTPLMAWVETHKAPEVLVAGKPVPQAGGQGGGPGGGPGGQMGGPGGPGGPPQGGQAAGGPGGGPGGPGAPGGQGGPGGPGGGSPYAAAPRPTVYTRPIYPYPNVAKYKGTGDPNDAANYEPVKGAAKYPQPFTNEAAKLLGPSVDKFYEAEGDKLVVVSK